MAPASRPTSLQQAASAVFAVTTVVPLLVFVWTLHRLGALGQAQSQVGLGLALGITRPRTDRARRMNPPRPLVAIIGGPVSTDSRWIETRTGEMGA